MKKTWTNIVFTWYEFLLFDEKRKYITIHSLSKKIYIVPEHGNYEIDQQKIGKQHVDCPYSLDCPVFFETVCWPNNGALVAF